MTNENYIWFFVSLQVNILFTCTVEESVRWSWSWIRDSFDGWGSIICAEHKCLMRVAVSANVGGGQEVRLSHVLRDVWDGSNRSAFPTARVKSSVEIIIVNPATRPFGSVQLMAVQSEQVSLRLRKSANKIQTFTCGDT